MYCRIPLKNFIDKKIQEFEGNKKIQDKYIWLKNYYNNIKHYKLTNEDINKLKALNLSKDWFMYCINEFRYFWFYT